MKIRITSKYFLTILVTWSVISFPINACSHQEIEEKTLSPQLVINSASLTLVFQNKNLQTQPFTQTDPQTHYIRSVNWRQNPFLLLKTQEGRNLILEWMSIYPGKEIEDKNQIQEFIKYLSNQDNHFDNSFTDPKFINRLVETFPFLSELGSNYQSSLRNYLPQNDGDPTQHIAAVQRVKLLQPFLKGPNLLDIGALTNHIAKRMVEQTPSIKRAIGVDITKHINLADDTDYLSFRLMHNASKIPVDNDFADSATLIYVLHHVEGDIHEYLKEVLRVLAPGGRLLVIEDTFSNILPVSFFDDESAVKNKRLQFLFDKLNDNEKLAFVFFADWFAHYFIKTARGTVVPGNYRSMEEWGNIFKKAGFNIIKERHLGFSTIGSRNPVSRGLFVLEKDVNADTSTSVPFQQILPGFVNNSQLLNSSI